MEQPEQRSLYTLKMSNRENFDSTDSEPKIMPMNPFHTKNKVKISDHPYSQ